MAHLDRSAGYLQLSETDLAALYLRTSTEELQREVQSVTSSPVVDGIMHSVGGLFAVLNTSRQIVAANDRFLSMAGATDTLDLMGVRVGEAIHCIHANDAPGGCGTGRLCASCGAAIAIVTSLAVDKVVERKCAASIWRNGRCEDMCFSVRSTPHAIGGRRFLMLLLQDISEQENWAEIERAFFHDMGNMVTGLVGASSLLTGGEQRDERLVKIVQRLSGRLENELRVQQSLVQLQSGSFEPELGPVSVNEVLDGVRDIFASHVVAAKKTFTIVPSMPEGRGVYTYLPLLLRVLANMITNAFEASQPGEEVRFWLEEGEGTVTFCVWNSSPVPDVVCGRIFQRYFSTKGGNGRGVGTYMMKYLGEKALKGKVCFTSEADGTIFRFAVPTWSSQGSQSCHKVSDPSTSPSIHE